MCTPAATGIYVMKESVIYNIVMYACLLCNKMLRITKIVLSIFDGDKYA